MGNITRLAGRYFGATPAVLVRRFLRHSRRASCDVTVTRAMMERLSLPCPESLQRGSEILSFDSSTDSSMLIVLVIPFPSDTFLVERLSTIVSGPTCRWSGEGGASAPTRLGYTTITELREHNNQCKVIRHRMGHRATTSKYTSLDSQIGIDFRQPHAWTVGKWSPVPYVLRTPFGDVKAHGYKPFHYSVRSSVWGY